MHTAFSGRFCSALIVVAVAAAAVFVTAGDASAKWTLIYSQDWSQGTGGWSAGQSALPGKRAAKRIYVGHPQAPYAIWFNGQCGWGFRTGASVKSPMMIVTRVYMLGSQRNALSINCRSKGGSLVYKYGMGGSNYVIANCQGSADQPVSLGGLRYALQRPYDLISVFTGNSFYVGLRDVITGEERFSPRRNNL